MLTLNLKDFKIDVNNYNNFVANLEVKCLLCPNCKACDFERHGYYRRYINISGTKYCIRILRVRCKICVKTHAVLPDFIRSSCMSNIKRVLSVLKDNWIHLTI